MPLMVGRQETAAEERRWGDDKLLRTIDLANVWQVDVATVRRWRVRYDIPTEYLPSGQPRYRVSELRRWFQKQRQQGLLPRPIRKKVRGGNHAP